MHFQWEYFDDSSFPFSQHNLFLLNVANSHGISPVCSVHRSFVDGFVLKSRLIWNRTAQILSKTSKNRRRRRLSTAKVCFATELPLSRHMNKLRDVKREI